MLSHVLSIIDFLLKYWFCQYDTPEVFSIGGLVIVFLGGRFVLTTLTRLFAWEDLLRFQIHRKFTNTFSYLGRFENKVLRRG